MKYARVASNASLPREPRVLLMDEPFGALEPQKRLQMQQMLLSLWHQQQMTVLCVTHDVDEAVFLNDRVVVLSERPARVRESFAVTLPRPRNADTLLSTEYARLRRKALSLLLC